MGPLTGLKVIELAHIMSGPTCGMLLADMGADVIKVEKIPGGDDTRRFTPPEIDGEAAAFLMMNRNKRGIAVNLKTQSGKDILRRLLSTADVVTENYRTGAMEKLDLGYEALRKINPGLIYAEISGYGRTGPYAGRGGFDLIAQGMSGMMSTMGEPGQAPIKAGAPVTDINAGILAALGVVAAYIHRLKTGEGQRVDTSLFEAGIQQNYWWRFTLPPALRRRRWAPAIRLTRPTRHSKRRTAGSTSAPLTRLITNAVRHVRWICPHLKDELALRWLPDGIISCCHWGSFLSGW